MKNLLLVLCLLVVGCVGNPTTKPTTTNSIVEDFQFQDNKQIEAYYRTIVKVHIVSREKGISSWLFGESAAIIPFPSTVPTTKPLDNLVTTFTSGVVIKETKKHSYILTVAHGFRGITPGTKFGYYVTHVNDQQLRDNNNNMVTADIYFIDFKSDICVLKTEKKLGFGSLDILENSYPPILTDVFIVGYPQGWLLSINKATLTSYFEKDDLIKIRFDGAVRPGNSGSPILDKNNRVLGIVTSLLDSHDGIGISGYEICQKIKGLDMP